MINSEETNFLATSCLVLRCLLEVNQQICHVSILKMLMLGEDWVEPWTSVHVRYSVVCNLKPPQSTYKLLGTFLKFHCNRYTVQYFTLYVGSEMTNLANQSLTIQKSLCAKVTVPPTFIPVTLPFCFPFPWVYAPPPQNQLYKEQALGVCQVASFCPRWAEQQEFNTLFLNNSEPTKLLHHPETKT